MSPVKHVMASGVTSALFFAATRSVGGSIACFLSGILIDIDHVFDFYIERKRVCKSLKELYDFCLLDKTGKLYLIFHAYEWVGLLWLAVILSKFHPVWLGIAVGISVHMLFDQLINPIYPLVYFWFFRRKFGFSKKLFFYDEFLKEQKGLSKS